MNTIITLLASFAVLAASSAVASRLYVATTPSLVDEGEATNNSGADAESAALPAPEQTQAPTPIRAEAPVVETRLSA